MGLLRLQSARFDNECACLIQVLYQPVGALHSGAAVPIKNLPSCHGAWQVSILHDVSIRVLLFQLVYQSPDNLDRS